MQHPTAAAPIVATLFAVAAPTLAADVTPASTFGSGCGGASLVTPTLTTPDVAVEGQTFLIEVTAGPNLAGELHLAVQKDAWLGFTLPLDLEFFGAEGCDLLVPPDVTVPILTDAEGQATVSLPGFSAGGTVFLQALLFDTDGSFGGPVLALSQGVELSSIAPSDLAPGDLVLTEIMANPNFLADSLGEWLEVYNPGPAPIDLRGWCLTDDSSQLVVLDADAPIEVAPQSYAVLGNNADTSTNGGIELIHDWTENGTYTLSSPTDAVRLVAPDGILIDEVVYGGGVEWINPIGASLELAEGLLGDDVNDSAAAWEVATCLIGGSGATFNTDRGTPGSAPGVCANSAVPDGTGEVVFNEVMQNPSQVLDANGEWFEVLNTTAAEIDLAGWQIGLGSSSFVVEGPLPVPAGGVQLFARNGDPAANGGLPAAYDYPDTLFLGNGSQSLSIADAEGALVCLLSYDNGATYPDPNGASMSLDPGSADLVGATDGTQWCEGSTAYGNGDLGSPGALNPPCGS